MKQAVQDNWITFNKPLEGVVGWMYLDMKGLVTTGMGNLIDSPQAAQALPWRASSSDAQFADPADELVDDSSIEKAWNIVKSHTELQKAGGGHFKLFTAIRLSRNDVNDLVAGKLSEFARHLKNTFPDFEDYPADAQLGLLSMAWAMGPAFGKNFPKFVGYVLDQDWSAAATECRFQPDTGTIKTRNDLDEVLFRNAQAVTDQDRDPDELIWPDSLQE